MTDPRLPHTHADVLHVLLAHWLADSAPGPTIPRWQRETERGLTDRDWHTCATCRGSGTKPWKGRQVACDNPRCKGEGGWRGDAYDNQHRHVHAEHAPELGVLEFTTSLLAFTDHPDHSAWKLCRVAHSRRGAIPDPDDLAVVLIGRAGHEAAAATERQEHSCFRLIDEALTVLRDRHPFNYVAVLKVHVLDSLPHEWAAGDRDDYRVALTYLARLLGPRFRAPRWARVTAQERKAA